MTAGNIPRDNSNTWWSGACRNMRSKRMNRVEHRFILDPQTRQDLDIEKSAVSQFLVRRTPEGQPAVLPADACIQSVRGAVQTGNLGAVGRIHLRCLPARPVQPIPPPAIQSAGDGSKPYGISPAYVRGNYEAL